LTSEPPNVDLTVEFITECDVIATGTLLNPGDKVTISFILVGKSDTVTENTVKVSGRIIGVKEFKVVNADQKEFPTWAFTGIVAILTVVVSSLINYIFGSLEKRLKKEDGTG
jgi:hypothetical protein